MHHFEIPGVTIGHSAVWTWDGEVLIFGHEPGGGGQAQCQATTPEVNRTMFFFESRTGVELGRHVLPRPQTSTENCTIHNYNIVPTRDGSYIAVMGNYQAGTWVVEFTDPANPRTVGWSDPPVLMPQAVGGAWSTYWYNGETYGSEIARGLDVYSLTPTPDMSANEIAAAREVQVGRLNVQHQDRITWSPTIAVIRSFRDQLVRADAIDAETLARRVERP